MGDPSIRRVRLRFVCDVEFAALPGEGSERWCERCQRPVHDLAALTEEEAQPLLRTRLQQRVCVMFRTRPDGSIRFRVPAAAAAAFLAACNGGQPTRESPDAAASVVHEAIGTSARLVTDVPAVPADAGDGDAASAVPHARTPARCAPKQAQAAGKAKKAAVEPVTGGF